MSLTAQHREAPGPGTLWAAALGGAATVALALATPIGPLAALGAAILVLSALRPWWGVLTCVAVSLAMHADAMMAYRLTALGFSIYPPDAVGLATALGLGLSRVLGVSWGGAARLSRPLLLWLVYCYLMCGFALLRGLEPREVLADWRPFGHYAVALVIPAMLVSPARMRSLIWTLLVSSAFGSAYGIFHSLHNEQAKFYEINLGFARLTGGSEGVYAPMVCFGVAVLTLSRSRSLRAFAAAQLVLSGTATVLTYSRGAWLGTLAGLLVLGLVVMGRRPGRLLPVAFWVGVASVLVVKVLEWQGVPVVQGIVARGKETGGTRDIALLHRFVEYQTVWRAFLSNPVLGAGPGTLFHYFMPGMGWVSSSYTHNSFFYIAAKWGLLGLGLYLNFFVRFLWRAARAVRAERLDDRTVLLAGLLATVVALTGKSLSSWFLNIFHVSLWLGVMLGTLDALARPEPELPREIR
ncbi:MAG: O-antigen ligase family protein [Candidatus Eisenbacteria bacterium]|nr:O-antigen ligase family protein [Candidatus Eisenbacteria bacterium]